MRKKSIILLIALLVLVPVICVLIFDAHRTQRLSQFDSLIQGMSEREVEILMGKPSAINKECRDAPSWIGERVQGQCTLEYHYDGFIIPEFWTIGFDANGHVIAKEYYTSP
ncbi:hypothetical protein ACO0LD_19480 [Undibacterium sp. Ji83W]|uniref:hypothetical protein n=1 Tax=Undibacterium sp. Ji83W TaxID=3413043 RepID=UPI003BF1624A